MPIVSAGRVMAPLTSESVPSAVVSFVVPPWFVSCVTVESRVSWICEPGAPEPERVKTMCATWFPGAPAFDVNGTVADPSANVASQEMEPAPDGDDSNVGDSDAVMPARVNVAPEIADDGE